MTTTVNTVRGPVDVDSLGATLMHEHVLTLNVKLAITPMSSVAGTGTAA